MGGARAGGLFIKCDADRRGPIHYRQMIAGPPPPPQPALIYTGNATTDAAPGRPCRGETNLSLSLFLHRIPRRTHTHITAHAHFYTAAAAADLQSFIVRTHIIIYIHAYTRDLHARLQRYIIAACPRTLYADK